MEIADSPLFERTPRPFSRFLVYLSICLAMIAIDSKMNYLQAFRQSAKNAFLPIQLIVVSGQGAVQRFFGSVFQSPQLSSRLANYEQENLKLNRRIEALQNLTQENESLRVLLGLTRRNEEQWVSAEIVARQYVGSQQKVLINKGLDQGLRLGFPVVAEKGLFGQVSKALKSYTEVQQINDKGMSVPVKVQGTNILGVIYGSGEERVEFRHFLSRWTINIGDELVTSGIDGLFPPDIPVAKVIAIAPANQSGGVRVEALPGVNFPETRFVATPTLHSDYGEWLESLQKNALVAGRPSPTLRAQKPLPSANTAIPQSPR